MTLYLQPSYGNYLWNSHLYLEMERNDGRTVTLAT